MGLLMACTADAFQPASSLDGFRRVSVTETNFVTEDGQPIALKGCNTGNWFLLEMWMLSRAGDGLTDDHTFNQNLVDRFGEQRAWELMDLYRENWMRPRDFEIISSFGFNVVRVPFSYELVARHEGDELVLRDDPFRWLDRAVELAEQQGIHVILDMHAVPGRQSVDQPAGLVGKNQLWGSRENQQRTVWLWKEIAAHYAGRKSIAGYDIINEPYGDFSMDVRPVLGPLAYEIAAAIRSEDPEVVIFFSNPIWGGHGFYGRPADRGFTNIAFTEHHYPGLFGSERSLRSHWGLLAGAIPAKIEELRAQGAPLFVGEFNPVFEDLGGGDLMRAYFDAYAEAGWASTMWSYKILSEDGGSIVNNWHMVSNAEPLPPIDFRTASEAEIGAWMQGLGSMELVVDEPMREALTRPDPVAIPVFQHERGLAAPLAHDTLQGWTATDIGGAKAGGQKVHHAAAIEVYGAGADIWASNDSFRFVAIDKPADELAARLHHLKDTHQYAKAGLMLRAGREPDAPMAMVHAFPDGRVAFGHRASKGGSVVEHVPTTLPFPIELRLARANGKATGWCSGDGGATWTQVGEAAVDGLDDAAIGLAVLSHEAGRYAAAGFSQIRVDGAPAADASDPYPPAPSSRQIQLKDASLDSGAGWQIEGPGMEFDSEAGRLRTRTAPGSYPHAAKVIEGMQAGAEASATFHARAAGATRDGEWAAVVVRMQLQLEDGRWLTFAEQRTALSGNTSEWTTVTLAATLPSERVRLTVGVESAGPPLEGTIVDLDDVQLMERPR